MKTQFSNNRTQPKTSIGNSKSGSKVAAEVAADSQSAAGTGPEPTASVGRRSALPPADQKSEGTAWAGRWSALPADHLKRWEKRLYTPKSGGVVLRKLAVRVQHLGRREEFRFDTTNHAAAAAQALDMFRHLKANGWEATLAKFKPETVVPLKLDVTIGDYCAAVRDLSRLRLRTFLNYANSLRTIAAEVFRVKPDKGASKFDYRSPDNGHAKWLAKIESRRLEELTPDRVTVWKRQRIAHAGSSPAAIAAAKRTVNSYIRCARSLFSPAIVRELKNLELPAPLPFDGVELEEAGSMKYVSKINPQPLIAAAKAELKGSDPEAYKAFLLGLFAGMRKAEIDLCEWRMVDFTANVIRLEQTEWLHLKTQDSAAEITVDPEVICELRALMPPPTEPPAPWSQFILVSPRPPRPDSARPYYRCEDTFARLNEWLRQKGIGANKPLHELRKELGALIATQHGIYAASRFLRHSDISTTARHYADQKARINVGLGVFLDTDLKTVPQTAVKAA